MTTKYITINIEIPNRPFFSAPTRIYLISPNTTFFMQFFIKFPPPSNSHYFCNANVATAIKCEGTHIKIPLTFARDLWASGALSPANLHFSSHHHKRADSRRENSHKPLPRKREGIIIFCLMEKVSYAGLFATRCRRPTPSGSLFYFILNEEKISINFIRPWLKAAVAAKNGSQVHNSPHSWDSLGCLIMIVSSLVDEATWTSRACMQRVASRI